MRIAAAFDSSSNSHYRAQVPMQALAARGHAAYPFGPIPNDRPSWDLLHVYRIATPEHIAFALRLRGLGIAVVFDIDDHLVAFVRGDRTTRSLGGKRKIRQAYERTIEMARTAHLLTTPSATLADVYRDEGVEHVAVIENYVAPQPATASRRRHAGLVIGCVAGREHEVDFKRMGLREVLVALMERYPQVRVVTVGVDLKLKHPRYTNHLWIDIDRLIDHERGFDIGFAPLVDNAFNCSRSNVKLKEYAAAGLPWLASPVGPYRDMGPSQGGELVADDDWFDAFSRLIEDYRHRATLAAAARRWAAGQTLRVVGAAWEQAFRDASARARREAAAPA